MTAVKNDAPFDLRSPNTGAVVETVQARYLWDNLVEGAWQNGEPGVIFLDHPQANPLPGLGPIEATNPCVTADTWVTTSQGARRVADLIGRPFEALVDGTAYRSSDAGFFLTGVKPVFEVTTSRGFSLKATSDHKVLCLDAQGERHWKTVGSLTTDDDIVVHEHRALTWGGRGSFDEGRRIGSLLAGDDRARTDGYRTLGISGPRTASRFAAAERGGRSNNRRDARGTSLAERGAEPTTSADLANLAASFGLHAPETEISAAVEAGSSLFTAGVLRSLFDADGRVHGTADDGVSVRLSSTKVSNLEAVQRMLARLGIISTIVPNRPSGADACHAAHELQVSDAGLEIFAERIGIADADADALLQQGLSAHGRARTASTFAARVLSVNALGEAPVFDCQIAQAHAFDANGLYVHNCGEQLLHGGDSCNLGSINVGNFYDAATNDVAWDRLRAATRIAITFLDDVIDENVYSLPKIAEMVHNNRRVGLGIMGFAELIAHLQIEYGSADCIAFASKLMKCIKDAAEEATIALGAERGDFPNKHLSVFADDARPRRNVALLSIAPTGTISMLAGCAFGCEPYFAMAYTKNVMKDAEGRPQKLYYKVPLFEEIARREGFYSDALLEQVENNGGSVKGLAAVPAAWQRAFTVTADVSVEAHIDMLAAFQEHVCNAVSKTINAPNADTKDSTSRAILRAYEKGCKGFTYYRDGSRTEQVVDIGVKASGTTTDASASPETATPDASSDIESILAKANALLEVPTS
jgi:ribonucleoside-diphosphate reductase alpha chain